MTYIAKVLDLIIEFLEYLKKLDIMFIYRECLIRLMHKTDQMKAKYCYEINPFDWSTKDRSIYLARTREVELCRNTTQLHVVFVAQASYISYHTMKWMVITICVYAGVRIVCVCLVAFLYRIYGFGSRVTYVSARLIKRLRFPTVDNLSILVSLPVEITPEKSVLGARLRLKPVLNESGDKYVNRVYNSNGVCLGYVSKEVPVKGLGVQPEMAVKGSKMVTMPSGGASVVLYNDLDEVVGNGFRYGDHLLTNRHVGIESTTWGKPSGFVRFELGEMHTAGLDLDFAFYKVPARQFAALGVKAHKQIGRLRPSALVQVEGYCPRKNVETYVKSRGCVGNEASRGMVEHGCSTYPGMSGSPVYSGSQLVGMHSGSGSGSEEVNYLLCFEVVRFIFDAPKYARLGISMMVQESLGPGDNEFYGDVIRDQTKRNRKLARAFAHDDFTVTEEDDYYEQYVFARDEGLLEGGAYGLDFDEFIEFVDTGNISHHGSTTLRKKLGEFSMRNMRNENQVVQDDDDERKRVKLVKNSRTLESAFAHLEALKDLAGYRRKVGGGPEGLTRVGTANPKFRQLEREGAKPDEAKLKVLQRIFKKVDVAVVLQYANPPKGEKAKLSAYSKHVSRKRLKPLDEKSLSRAVRLAADQRGVLEIDGPTDRDFEDVSKLYALVEQALDGVALDKTPGYPLNLLYSNNKLAIEGDRDMIIGAAVARLKMMSSPDTNYEEILEQPGGLVWAGLIDPSSVFIKDEPHPKRKVDDGRYRCITPVSLTDQLVESVLFTESSRQLRKEDRIYINGSAVGIGFTDDQTKTFCDTIIKLNAKHGPPISDDMSGFDALHTEQTLDATCEIDRLTHKSLRGSLDKWNLCNRRWAKHCAHSATIIGNRVYIKVNPGGLNSGSKDTSRRNGSLRVEYSFYISIESKQEAEKASANGDDGLTWGVNDLDAYKEAARKWGFTLRDVTRYKDTLEFCSHTYDLSTKKASLTSWPKAIYRILTREVPYSDAMQVVDECRHNIEFEKIRQFVEETTRE